MSRSTIFLLSPAHCGGRRARTLLTPAKPFDLAERFHTGSTTLGEVFAYVSGLYFRGKLAYALAFQRAPLLDWGAWVITAGEGLERTDRAVGPADLERWSGIPIEADNPRYAEPLRHDLQRMAEKLGPDDRVVLLGSIATPKYVELLTEQLGEALMFPGEFVGKGDMQRGSMLLKAAEAGIELEYVSAIGAERSRAATRRRT